MKKSEKQSKNESKEIKETKPRDSSNEALEKLTPTKPIHRGPVDSKYDGEVMRVKNGFIIVSNGWFVAETD